MRGLISAAVVIVAVVLQLAVADQIAFPGGSGPDLVLLAVAALALATGPLAGSLTGFWAGLALDVAPPAGHLVGQNALVFCLVGYACGLLATRPSAEGVPEQEHSALFEIGVTAAGAACGEVLIAALGLMLSDPRVTWAAIKHVLPVSIGYDLLLSPFVLFAVAEMLRLAGATGPRRAGQPTTASWRAAWAAVPTAGAVRQVAGKNPPRLRLSGQGEGRPGTGKPVMGRREPRLKLGRGTGFLTGKVAGAAFSRPGGRPGGPSGPAKLKFGSASSRPPGVRPPGARLGGARLGSARLAGSRLGASLLGGSVFSRPGPPFGRSALRLGRSRSLRGSGILGTIGKTYLGPGTHKPQFRKPGALTRWIGSLHRPAQPKAPGKRWLRGKVPGGTAATRSALPGRRVRPGIRSPGRGWLRRSRGFGGGLGRPRPRKPATPRLGSRRSRPDQKSWRRSGGYW